MIKVNELYNITPCKKDHVWNIFWLKEVSLAEDVKPNNDNPIHNLAYEKQKKYNLEKVEAIAICMKCNRIKLYNHNINMYTFAEQQMDNGEADEYDLQKLYKDDLISKEEYENLRIL